MRTMRWNMIHSGTLDHRDKYESLQSRMEFIVQSISRKKLSMSSSPCRHLRWIHHGLPRSSPRLLMASAGNDGHIIALNSSNQNNQNSFQSLSIG
jgi:hypothetical protein